MINLVRSVLVCTQSRVFEIIVNSLGCNHMCIYTPITRNDELVNENQIHVALIQYLEFSSLWQYAGVHNYMLHVDKFKSHVNLIITHVNMIIFDVWGRNTPPSSTWEREREREEKRERELLFIKKIFFEDVPSYCR